MFKIQVKPEQLLTLPVIWASVDYREVSSSTIDQEFQLNVSLSGTGHGLLVWFDAELAGGIEFSNAPGQPDLVYGRTFFPWERPVNLEAGDRIATRLAAKRIGRDYLWRWESIIFSNSGEIKEKFKQSTFASMLLSEAGLKKKGTSLCLSSKS